MRLTSSRWRRFPKFDSTPSLVVGIVFASVLSTLNIWSIASGRHDAIFPFQVSKWLGLAVGLALSVHTADVLHSRKKL